MSQRFDTLYIETARQCNDYSDSDSTQRYQRYPVAEYKKWVNWAQEYLARVLPVKHLKSLRANSATTQIAVSSTESLPTDFLRPIVALRNGKFCVPTGEDYLRLKDVNSYYQATESNPKVIYEGSIFRIFPSFAVGTTWDLSYVKKPDRLVADATETSIPDEFEHLLVKKAVSYMRIVDGDERGVATQQEVDAEINRMITISDPDNIQAGVKK